MWGHGILSWAVDGTRIVHPLVTTQVQLSFDPDTGAISVEPEALVPHLEIDLLQGLGLNGFDLLVDIRDRFRADPVGPFDERSGKLYEQLLAPLGLDGQVVQGEPARSGRRPRRRSRPPGCCWSAGAAPCSGGSSPACVMRWCPEQIEVAAPLAAVVADEPSRLDLEGSLADEDGSWQQAAERLLMPLPTNPEQEAVARRLAEHRGVTVQGPPGTGKTHTIANLISHLVGHGKRVLVTSQKEQALSVLRDKIPESIRDLSVAVLGNSAASIAQLDQSVQAIYEHAVGLDRAPARARIAELDVRLSELHREIGALRSRISASIARERDSYTIGTATHTPSTLGQWLAANAADLGYIPDRIEPSAACPADRGRDRGAVPAGQSAGSRRLRCRRACRLPAAEQLPSPSELASAAAELREMRDRLAATEGVVEDRLALERLGPEGLSALTDAVERAGRQLGQLEQPWLAAVRAELRTAAFAATWRDQVKALREGIEELAAWRGRLLGHAVVLPDTACRRRSSSSQLERLRDRLAAGKGVSKTFQKDLYQVREACTVDEEPPRSAGRRRAVRHRGALPAPPLRTHPPVERRRRPDRRAADRPGHTATRNISSISTCTASATPSPGKTAPGRILRERLRAAGVQRPRAARLRPTWPRWRRRSGPPRCTSRRRNWHARLDVVRKYLADGASQPHASGLWRVLLDAFDASAWDRWGRAVEEVRRIRALTGDVDGLDELTRRLAEAAPVWTSRIVESRGDEAVAGPAATAPRAWEWRQADTWLSAITGADDPAVLQRQLESKLRSGRHRHRRAWRPNRPGWPWPSGSPTPNAGH